MRKIIRLVILAVSMIGCHSTDPVNNAPLIQIKFSNYVVDGYDGYAIATDPNGNILAKSTIENLQTNTLAPTKGYNGTLINLYLIVKGNPFYHTSAYLNIKRGSTWDFTAQSVKGNLHDPIKIKLKNLPTTFDYLTFGTNGFGYTLGYSSYADTTWYGTSFNYFDNGKAYAQVVTNEQGKYNFFDIDNTKKQVDVDFNNLSKTSLKKTISIPAANNSSYSLNANPSPDSDATYWLFNSTFYNATNLTIFYPDISMYQYNSNLVLYWTNKYFLYENNGNIITHYDPLKMDATIINSNPSKFEANFTGDFDYYNAEYEDAARKNFIHVFSAKSVFTFSIPDFTSEIPVPKISFSDMKLTSLALINNGDLVENETYFKYYSTVPQPITSSVETVVLTYP